MDQRIRTLLTDAKRLVKDKCVRSRLKRRQPRQGSAIRRTVRTQPAVTALGALVLPLVHRISRTYVAPIFD